MTCSIGGLQRNNEKQKINNPGAKDVTDGGSSFCGMCVQLIIGPVECSHLALKVLGCTF